MKNVSIRGKLILITTASCAVALLIFALVFASRDGITARATESHTLDIQARVVGANCAAALSFGDQTTASEFLQALQVDSQIDIAALYDSHGKLFAEYKSESTHLSTPSLLASSGKFDPNSYLSVREPVTIKGETVGTVMIIENLSELRQRANSLLTTMMLLSLGCIITTVVIASRLQGVISTPIRSLLQTMTQVSEKKDYGVRLEVGAKDEIGKLVEGFNHMLGEIEVRDRELEDRVARRTAALSEEIQVRRKTEEDLEEALHEQKSLAEAARAASEAKSQFLANMSHEIRTPMNGVIGLTSILLETNLDEEQQDLTRTIKFSGESLLAIINDILDFSKAEAGKFQLQPEQFSLSVLIEETGELMAQPAESKGLELICHCDPRIPSVLNADYGRLRQVVLNLLSNAIKFTSKGEIVLEATLRGIRAGTAQVEISVTDTGMGIPLAQQAKVFESFTQADGTSTRTHGGTGLGLTICKQIVELMNGTLSLKSEPGAGSTFTCTIPFEVVQNQCDIHSNLEGLNFLVVDDNATNRRILRQQLHSWGSHCDLVESGSEAVQVLKGKSSAYYAGVIMDMHMPEMDGAQATAEIKKDPAFARLPIILLSSLGMIRSQEELRQTGFAAGLTKPVRPSRLHNAILVTLNRAAPAEHSATLSASSMSTKPTVLLVEDNAVNRKVAERVLDKLGFAVETAVDGSEAVPMANSRKYDLILMDIQMPKMDGYAATAMICDLPGDVGKKIPIIAMTANAMAGDREQCLAAGMDDYISKPFTREDLSAVLDRWFQHAAAA